MQLGFERILRDGAGSLRYWSGFSFTYPPVVMPFVHGIVITPRWVNEFISKKRRAGASEMFDLPVMLDNGAFAAWRDGVQISAEDQLLHMERANFDLVAAGFVVQWAVVPDIVEGGARSLERTEKSVARIRAMSRPMVPIQEGIPADAVVRIAHQFDGGVFVGGGTMEYKRVASAAVRKVSPNVHIHVARIHTDGQLHFHSGIADTFDNTTFVQGLRWNQARLDRTFELIADRYLERRTEPECAKSTL
jgi:hypothetical protein